MTLALTNIDLLHRGWEDAVSEITPHLPEVRATMETEYAALLHESRIDEQALLAAVREVATVAARAAGADKARLLSRSMHRSVYEYLLSLDAMTPEETAGDADNGGVATDPSRLIGMEEVAEIEGRQAAIRAEEEAAAAAIAAAAQAEADRVAAERAEAERAAAEAERLEAEERAEAERIAAELRAEAERVAAERAAAEQAAAERAAAHRAAAERAAQERAAAERAAQDRANAEAEAERVATEERAAADRAAAYRASLDAEATAAVEELPGVDPAGQTELETDDEAAAGGFYRPRFKLFRREIHQTGQAGTDRETDREIDRETDREQATTGSPSWWRGPDAPPAPPQESDAEPAPVEPIKPAASMEPAAAEPAGTSPGSAAVEHPPARNPAPFAEPAPVPRPKQAPAPEVRAKAPAPDAGFAVQPRDGFHLTEFADFVRPAAQAAPQPTTEAPEEAAPAVDGDGGKALKGWHVRSSRRPNSGDTADLDIDDGLDEDDWEERRLIDSDPAVAEAHGDVNDLLRRRKCDEAASLLQKLAADHGSRSVAELALDAGDRCRALGKGNAALSCYIAASRADPSLEGPLMRLADVCLDDRDIDLAVTYLERVAKLHRQRGDNRGALRLYRKIATIAPYRDDILATLMRANTTGQFED